MSDSRISHELSHPSYIRELIEKAERDDPEAMYELAFQYFGNRIRVQPKKTWLSFWASVRDEQHRDAIYEEAIYWLYRSAAFGCSDAQFRLGLFLVNGLLSSPRNYIERNPAEGRRYLTLAADAGHAEAKDALEGRPTFTFPNMGLW